MTKTEKIRRALLKTPKAKAKVVAERLGVTVQDVYDTRYQMKKESKAYPHSYARAATPLETPVNMRKEMLKEVMPGLKALFGTDYAGTLPEVKEEVVKTDMVNHPPHYTVGGIEVIDFIEAKGLNYHLGQVIKYVSRAGKKGDALQDLQKARWYLNREIARVE